LNKLVVVKSLLKTFFEISNLTRQLRQIGDLKKKSVRFLKKRKTIKAISVKKFIKISRGRCDQ